MVDIGGGASDIAIFTEGAIKHTAVIPIAGDQVTMILRWHFDADAKRGEIKIKYGCALASLAGEQDNKSAQRGRRDDRDLSRQALAEVIEPRYEELFTLIWQTSS